MATYTTDTSSIPEKLICTDCGCIVHPDWRHKHEAACPANIKTEAVGFQLPRGYMR